MDKVNLKGDKKMKKITYSSLIYFIAAILFAITYILNRDVIWLVLGCGCIIFGGINIKGKSEKDQ